VKKNLKTQDMTGIGHHGWVSIQNPVGDVWDELSELIQEAYLSAAPKRLVKQWNELHKK
jgi:hypothetical protein